MVASCFTVEAALTIPFTEIRKESMQRWVWVLRRNLKGKYAESDRCASDDTDRIDQIDVVN